MSVRIYASVNFAVYPDSVQCNTQVRRANSFGSQFTQIAHNTTTARSVDVS